MISGRLSVMICPYTGLRLRRPLNTARMGCGEAMTERNELTFRQEKRYGKTMKNDVIAKLAEDYPQLYLDPDRDSQEEYRRIVLRGEEPGQKNLAQYQGDPSDRLETAETPAGPVRVATLGNRQDFERVIRSLMAAKSGPLAKIPETQGASMLTLFNWPRIHAHLAGFPEEEQAEEFNRFTAVKANYIDMLVVLSRGPYSHVDASAMGHTEEEWLALSDTIRRWHELTHVICRRLYPGDVDPVRDELIADAVGLYAAYGSFDPEKEKLFLGIRGREYTGGRLGNYTDTPEQQAGTVCDTLEQMKKEIGAKTGADPFDLIPVLMGSA